MKFLNLRKGAIGEVFAKEGDFYHVKFGIRKASLRKTEVEEVKDGN
jgi:hypothetical protein